MGFSCHLTFNESNTVRFKMTIYTVYTTTSNYSTSNKQSTSKCKPSMTDSTHLPIYANHRPTRHPNPPLFLGTLGSSAIGAAGVAQQWSVSWDPAASKTSPNLWRPHPVQRTSSWLTFLGKNVGLFQLAKWKVKVISGCLLMQARAGEWIIQEELNLNQITH